VAERLILGLDPGTARTGYGLIVRDGATLTMRACGLLETPAGDAAAERLKSLAGQLKQLLELHHPAEVAIEQLFFATNAKTAMQVAEARGVLLAGVAMAGIDPAEYTPLQVKQSVSGNGQADKIQVATMVCRLLNLKEAPKPDDVTDALAIALCHAQWNPALSA
jgi:crossover junction endodeoxyribonuclease RuvC